MKDVLKTWNKEEFGMINMKIEEWEKEIDKIDKIIEERNFDIIKIDRKKLFICELWFWIGRNEVYWVQIFRDKWIK